MPWLLATDTRPIHPDFAAWRETVSIPWDERWKAGDMTLNQYLSGLPEYTGPRSIESWEGYPKGWFPLPSDKWDCGHIITTDGKVVAHFETTGGEGTARLAELLMAANRGER